MRETELVLSIFYKPKEIAHPAEFVQDFLNLWEKDGRESFRFYKGSKPAPAITSELLETNLTFGNKDKPDRLKPLHLKTSLKRNNVIAWFLFEHPNSKPFAGRERLSSVSVYIPFSKTQEVPYQPQQLMDFFIALLSGRRISSAFVEMNSSVEFENDIHKSLFDILNYLRDKDYIFPSRRLRWATFFPLEEIEMAQKQFEAIQNGFTLFCDSHGLYLQTLEHTDGALIRMRGAPEDTPEYYQRVLRNNQDFYQAMRK